MKLKVLFVHSGNETFTKLDQKLLESSNNVYNFYVQRKFPAGFYRYWHEVRNVEIIFCWFASWNSFWILWLARLFKKPSLLVIGGYDTANLPEANYGHQRGGIQKYFSRCSMNLATWLLPFSYYSKEEAQLNTGIPSKKMKVIYLGVPDPFKKLQQTTRANMVLTVGKIEWPNLKRKGLEPFVRSAKLLPDTQFVLVGSWTDDSIEYLRSIAPPNVIFTGWISNEKLLDYYQQASVYIQASLHEGFGLSVAEAMLAGCIPVATRAGSLPEVIGDCGYYCDSPNPMNITNATRLALNATWEMRQRARDRILEQFPIDRRKKELLQIIELTLQNNGAGN